MATTGHKVTPKKDSKAALTSKMQVFLEAYRETGNVTRAALMAKVSRRRQYYWLEGTAYSEAFEDAQEHAVETLEKEARRGAMFGVEQPVFYKGEVCGLVRKHSDVLLIFLLKGLGPEVYRENRHITGNMNVNVTEQALLEARQRASRHREQLINGEKSRT